MTSTASTVTNLPSQRAASDQPLPVHAALNAVMDDVRSVRKGDRNEQQNFAFRGIDAVVNAVGPALRKHGVIVTPNVRSCERSVVHVGQRQTPMGHVAVIVEYTFTGPAGDSIVCATPGEAMDSGDKATAKAMSVAFRTALLQALTLPTDEIDPDAQTYQRAPAPVRDERMDLIRDIANACDSQNISKDGVMAKWAQDHDGEAINDAKDMDALWRLLDTIRRGEWEA